MQCQRCGKPCIAGMNICQDCLEELEAEERRASGEPESEGQEYVAPEDRQTAEEGIPLSKAVLAVVITLVIAVDVTIFTLFKIGAWDVIIGKNRQTSFDGYTDISAQLGAGDSFLEFMSVSEWFVLENGQFDVAMTVGSDGRVTSARLAECLLPEGGEMFFYQNDGGIGLRCSGSRELDIPLGTVESGGGYTDLLCNKIHFLFYCSDRSICPEPTYMIFFRTDTDIDSELASKLVGSWSNGGTTFTFDALEGADQGYYAGSWTDQTGDDPIEWVVAGDNLLIFLPSEGTVQAFAAYAEKDGLMLSCWEPDGQGNIIWNEIAYSRV